MQKELTKRGIIINAQQAVNVFTGIISAHILLGTVIKNRCVTYTKKEHSAKNKILLFFFKVVIFETVTGKMTLQLIMNSL